MENIITEKDSKVNKGKIFPEFGTIVQNQYVDFKIRENSYEYLIVKRRKLKANIRTIMKISKYLREQ